MPTPNSNTKITQVAPRLVDLLEYVEYMVRLTERPVLSIRDHKNLLYFEHELQGRIGIYHDQQDENGPIWLKIDRLKRIDPPDVPEEIKAWVTVSRDPARAPQVLESRMETMSETEARALVEKGIVNTEDVSKALKQSQFGPKMFDVFLRLEQQPELRSAIEAYIAGPWKTWADPSNSRPAGNQWRTGELAKGVSALEGQLGRRAKRGGGAVERQSLSSGHETPKEVNL